MTLHVVKYGNFVLWRQHIGMIIPWSEKGKVQLKAKTCLQHVNPLIPEMRLTGKFKKITSIYFQKNPVSGHFAPKFQLATQGKLEAIFWWNFA